MVVTTLILCPLEERYIYGKRNVAMERELPKLVGIFSKKLFNNVGRLHINVN